LLFNFVLEYEGPGNREIAVEWDTQVLVYADDVDVLWANTYIP
jgi:hypothetical protein